MRMFGPEGPTFLELAVEALSSTRVGYDLLAPKFEHTPYRTPDEVLEKVAELAGKAERLLDLCCGTGAAMRWFRPHCDHLVGLDFSPGMLEEAERLSKEWPEGGKLEWRLGLAEELDFAAEFDLVTCFGAMGHFLPEDQYLIFSGVFRALRPQGRFLFVTAPRARPWQKSYWKARTFDALMRLRNALLEPEFIMYYTTFNLETALWLLPRVGFELEIQSDVFDEPYSELVLVTARRP